VSLGPPRAPSRRGWGCALLGLSKRRTAAPDPQLPAPPHNLHPTPRSATGLPRSPSPRRCGRTASASSRTARSTLQSSQRTASATRTTAWSGRCGATTRTGTCGEGGGWGCLAGFWCIKGDAAACGLLVQLPASSHHSNAFASQPPAPLPPRLHCPGLRVPAALLQRQRPLLLAAIRALQPSRYFAAVLQRRRARLAALTGQSLTGAGAGAPVPRFNMLHLRVELDWFAHCAEWQGPAAGRDNCDNNTAAVGGVLRQHGFEPEVGGAGTCCRACWALSADLGCGAVLATRHSTAQHAPDKHPSPYPRPPPRCPSSW
jgi:hypothetical protein